MGIFSGLFKGGGDTLKGTLEGTGTLAKDLREAITGDIPAGKKAELELKAQEIEKSILIAQTEINKIDAQSQHGFQRNWRPFIGWVSGIGLMYHYLFMPMFYDIFQTYLKFSLQPVDGNTLTSLVVALLGLGGLRSVEKLSNSQSNH